MGKSLASQHPAGLRAPAASGDGYWELNLLDGSTWFSDWFGVPLDWRDESGRNAWSMLRDYPIPTAWARLLQRMRKHLQERTPVDLEMTVRASAEPQAGDPRGAPRGWRIRGAAERNSWAQPHYFSSVAVYVTTEPAGRRFAVDGKLSLAVNHDYQA